MKRIFFLTTAFLLLSFGLFAQSIKVAAAANLQAVIKVLQADFKKKTGIEIEPIVGSSGNLVNQIKNGAPYDVFLSADMTFPETLYKDGFSTKKPVVYAWGSLIICSNQDIGFENWERILLTHRVKKIAIANPAIAPYGKAADEVLQKKDILVNIKSKIVTGESISQVNTYITTGVVDVGFTTQALVKDPTNKTKLYWQIIAPDSYSPIEQGIVLLKRAETNKEAEKFYQYILSPAAKAIFLEYGYRVK
ncbi:molybdate transport system substrate-binding protein [Mucilaginibacter frigoritolerans]|jgi:molybdate transport system substrate-binding protein|uniref:Molybdate transport system substrate-binding protein n=1 Tax=Mucilaginibacter frigoritolerans TaxID=652788 RepID=A0A562TU55_9SPHI|nr:molybdate ABC transporter substrate-binding protein [Mucilaginibacter frigoritolerans]TWI97139.1 molybdate transport system substrate-binding protein [Mucilaginibacter frigoritolerans]